ncbi:hypothetical protein BJX63DRAFT_416113 [Aspergillus granulosus]|uniref:Uncharacterized protein n=1 Tax=Aspergillus granulosus TaxID=176169 RepID=A0ABR4GSG8_9EURO
MLGAGNLMVYNLGGLGGISCIRLTVSPVARPDLFDSPKTPVAIATCVSHLLPMTHLELQLIRIHGHSGRKSQPTFTVLCGKAMDNCVGDG